MSTILEEMNQLPALPLLPFHREQKTFLEGLVEILGSRVGVSWIKIIITILVEVRHKCSSALPNSNVLLCPPRRPRGTIGIESI